MPPGPSLSVGSNDRYEASACSLCRVSIDDELLAVTTQHSEMFRMVISVSKWFIVTVGIDNGNAYSGRQGRGTAGLFGFGRPAGGSDSKHKVSWLVFRGIDFCVLHDKIRKVNP